MKELIQRNYESIVKRGLINKYVTRLDFLDKLEEEVEEFKHEAINITENQGEELADVILVCFNYAKHYNIDIESELKKKIDKNFRR